MRYSVFFLLTFIGVYSTTWAQSASAKKAALQREYNSIMAEIKTLQSTIDQRKKERNISLKEIGLITQKIEKRKKLIANIEVQMKGINVELDEKQQYVAHLNDEIAKLKAEYAKLMVWLSKNSSNADNKLAFILESSSFREAYHRVLYIRKYGDYRAKQSRVMKNQIDRVLGRIHELHQVRAEKATLLEANMDQQKALVVEKKNRDGLVTQYNKELDVLKDKVQIKNKQAVQVNARIKKIIEEEIKKQRQALLAELRAKKRREAQKKNPAAKDEDVVLTDEDIEKSPEGMLSSSFQSSRGSMPWPVLSGVITSKFGRQPHADDPSIFVDNNGIDIKTNDNADVKCIYKGTVVRIFDMPSYHTCVMVKHGDFFTVYSYLKSTSVREGESIDARQNIGKCVYSDQHGYSLVNLQVWHFHSKQNPESWIRMR